MTLAQKCHNRIISGLTQAVITVERGKNSDGSDSQAWAKKQEL
jgi:predicted Rossmann fold nucleotide-binding protein DprA/Smf involved in DNA uptake